MSNGNSVRGNLRNVSRSPPFVIVGLLLVICILGFNYWNVSSRNSKFLQEIGELHDKYRLIALKKISLEKRNDGLLDRWKAANTQLSERLSFINKKELEISKVQRQVREKDNFIQIKDDKIGDCEQKMTKCTSHLTQCEAGNGRKDDAIPNSGKICTSLLERQKNMIINFLKKNVGEATADILKNAHLSLDHDIVENSNVKEAAQNNVDENDHNELLHRKGEVPVVADERDVESYKQNLHKDRLVRQGVQNEKSVNSPRILRPGDVNHEINMEKSRNKIDYMTAGMLQSKVKQRKDDSPNDDAKIDQIRPPNLEKAKEEFPEINPQVNKPIFKLPVADKIEKDKPEGRAENHNVDETNENKVRKNAFELNQLKTVKYQKTYKKQNNRTTAKVSSKKSDPLSKNDIYGNNSIAAASTGKKISKKKDGESDKKIDANMNNLNARNAARVIDNYEDEVKARRLDKTTSRPTQPSQLFRSVQKKAEKPSIPARAVDI